MDDERKYGSGSLEKRRFTRIVKTVPVEFKSCQAVSGGATARDVSEGGLCIEAEQIEQESLRELLSKKAEVSIKIDLPSEFGAVEVAAQIAWIKDKEASEGKLCFGVRFTGIPEEYQGKIKLYIERQSKITKLDFVPRKKDKNFDPEFVAHRRQWLSEKTNTRFFHTGYFSTPSEDMKGNIENLIGVTQIPIGVAGPLKINGQYAKGTFYIPLATTEGTLVETYQRGMLVITKAGGANVIVTKDVINVSPVFILEDISKIKGFILWVEENFEKIKEKAEKTTRYGKLLKITPLFLGKRVILNFCYTTGDAMGLNMINIATDRACEYIRENVKTEGFYLRSNFSSDKKASVYNLITGYGKEVLVEVTLSKKIVNRYLNSTPEEIYNFWYVGFLGSYQAGMIGLNAHFANGLAAIFIACGQDVAQIINANVGIVMCEITKNGDLCISAKFPNLVIGTVGGGTSLKTQRECLESIGCYGSDKAKKFAEIVAASILAGEISICAALASGVFIKAHETKRNIAHTE
ncbi:MAG: PilZ domain-containing protein [Candidatus Omnitrophica bacterium]|nr:PilZ domain-containing protein [Candidatus Omnitrophota bacterium]